MSDKRITIVSGHYGSGKTNIAVNLALDLRQKQENVAIADIDIVNPYFRTKDSEELLKSNGIRLICSDYANTNVDIPALPQDIYAITDDKSMHCILDVGGDERGALALGRISEKIVQEDSYQMFYVVNKYRPLTSTPDDAIEIMREIENACKIKFTAIVNNSNLGEETTKETVLSSMEYVKEISQKTNIPVKMTTVSENLFEELCTKIENLYSLSLQKNIIKEN